MAANLSGTEHAVKTGFQSRCMADFSDTKHDRRMQAKKVLDENEFRRSRYFFKEWRKYRSRTQAYIAERMGVAVATISQLENGKQGFSDRTLEALAAALSCHPGELLMKNPFENVSMSDEELKAELKEQFGRLPAEDQEELLSALMKTAIRAGRS